MGNSTGSNQLVPSASFHVKPVETWVSFFILFSGFGLSVTKAWLAPIVHDEAFTYIHHISRPWLSVFTEYTANNHLLNTVLAKLSAALFGFSELPLRVPALLGRCLFLVAMFLTVRWMTFSSCLLRLGCLLILAAQPFLAEMGACSRGYSLGLGFMFMGLYTCLTALQPGTVKLRYATRKRMLRYLGASILLGLAVLSVPIFINPSLAIAATFSLLELVGRSGDTPRLNPARVRHFQSVLLRSAAAVACIVIPASLMGLAGYWGFRESISLEHFKEAGSPTVWESYKSLWTAALVYLSHDYMHIRWVPAGDFMQWLSRDAGTVCGLFCMLLLWNNGFASKGIGATMPVAAVLLLCIIAVLLQHWIWGVYFPVNRTGIYYIPLSILVSFGALAAIWTRLAANGLRAVRMLVQGATVGGIGVVLLISVLATSMNHYFVWPHNPPARDVMRRLANLTKDDPPQEPDSVKLMSNWLLDVNLNYYRLLYNVKAVQVVQRLPDIKGWPDDAAYYLVFDWDPQKTFYREIARYPRYNLTLYRGK